VIHADPNFSAFLGSGCHVAHGAIIHHSHIGNDVLIGIGAIILPNCQIEDDVVIAAGSLLTAQSQVPSGEMVMGRPGKATKNVSPEMLNFIRFGNQAYQELCGRYLSGLKLIQE
jgi:carbonic anhydrase/acetyltransferase-like protein (isoleucine patch superfamily)